MLFDDYGGDWEPYCDALYGYFSQDFIQSRPAFRGETLVLKRHPIVRGKEATFWHIISTGDREDDRNVDFRRCERVRWPRRIIENSLDPLVKVWTNDRSGEERICLWFEDHEYLVVLTRRKGYLLLWTEYPATRPHSKRKLLKEYLSSRS